MSFVVSGFSRHPGGPLLSNTRSNGMHFHFPSSGLKPLAQIRVFQHRMSFFGRSRLFHHSFIAGSDAARAIDRAVYFAPFRLFPELTVYQAELKPAAHRANTNPKASTVLFQLRKVSCANQFRCQCQLHVFRITPIHALQPWRIRQFFGDFSGLPSSQFSSKLLADLGGIVRVFS